MRNAVEVEGRGCDFGHRDVANQELSDDAA